MRPIVMEAQRRRTHGRGVDDLQHAARIAARVEKCCDECQPCTPAPIHPTRSPTQPPEHIEMYTLRSTPSGASNLRA
jgi:hypothetical protein